MTKYFEDMYAVANSLGICIFPVGMYLALGPGRLSKLFSTLTGWEMTQAELLESGERVFNLMKAFLVKKGLTRKNDDWPGRFYTEPLPDGPAEGAVLSRAMMDRLLDEYYELRGWDKGSGNPSKKKLAEIGLQEIAEDL